MAAENENETVEPSERSREMDGELRSIGRILRILDELSDDGKRRAVVYLASRYETVGMV